MLSLFYVLAVEAWGDLVGVKRSYFGTFLHVSELVYLGSSYFYGSFTKILRLVDQLTGHFHVYDV